MGDLLRCAIYIRVSSDEQAKYGDSMRDQENRGKEYIDSHKDMILHDIYIDDGVSGQKLLREDFTRLMDDIRCGRIDRIIFTKLDRWFRSLRHYLNTQAILEEHKVAWTAIDQPYFDTATPHGRAFVAQSMMWAELEAQNDGIRVRDVFANKVKYGEAITGKVPKGYKIEGKHLVLSEEAPAIHDSIMYYLQTNSLSDTLRYMYNKHGIDTTIQNLKQSILQNTKYTGRYRGNDHYCPRLISDEDFGKIQDALTKNVRSSQRYDYIFSGLLVCGECGRKLIACHINVTSHRKSGAVYHYRYPAYECKHRKAHDKCPNGGEIREKRIEEYVISRLRSALEGMVASYTEKENVVSDNRAARAALKKRMDRLKDLYLNEAISLDEYKLDRLKLEKQLESLPEVPQAPKDLSGARNLLNTNFEETYHQMSNQEKRRFWRDAAAEIRISRSENRQRTFEIFLR